MDPVSATILGVGSLIGGSSANKANALQAHYNRNFQRSESFAARSFIRDMSNSAHQREVADLKAAGLNPILSTGGMGAATNSPPMGSGAQAQQMDVITPAISTALQAQHTVAQVDKLESETLINTFEKDRKEFWAKAFKFATDTATKLGEIMDDINKSIRDFTAKSHQNPVENGIQTLADKLDQYIQRIENRAMNTKQEVKIFLKTQEAAEQLIELYESEQQFGEQSP